jgi:hypothetical protein
MAIDLDYIILDLYNSAEEQNSDIIHLSLQTLILWDWDKQQGSEDVFVSILDSMELNKGLHVASYFSLHAWMVLPQPEDEAFEKSIVAQICEKKLDFYVERLLSKQAYKTITDQFNGVLKIKDGGTKIELLVRKLDEHLEKQFTTRSEDTTWLTEIYLPTKRCIIRALPNKCDLEQNCFDQIKTSIATILKKGDKASMESVLNTSEDLIQELHPKPNLQNQGVALWYWIAGEVIKTDPDQMRPHLEDIDVSREKIPLVDILKIPMQVIRKKIAEKTSSSNTGAAIFRNVSTAEELGIPPQEGGNSKESRKPTI